MKALLALLLSLLVIAQPITANADLFAIVPGSGSGGGSVSVTSASNDIIVTPSPGTGTFTIGSGVVYDNQGNATTYTINATDMEKVVTHNTASAVAVSLPAPSTTGFGTNNSFTDWNLGAGTVTITCSSCTINGNATLALTQYQAAYFTNDGSTNYYAFISTLGSGAVSSVSNSDSTLTISPTTGAVVGSLNLAHANTWTKSQAVTPTTAAISTATFTPDFSASNNQNITLVHASCPCTLANPTNIVPGQSGVIVVKQSATGSDLINTYGTDYVFTNAVAPTLSTAASAVDELSYYVVDSTHIRIAPLISSIKGVTTEGVISTGTKFTTSGCSVSATTGGATAGKYTSGTTGTCTVVVTMNGATGLTAPNGWSCWANDETTTADKQQTTASNTTTATIAGTTVSGDVIDFGCVGF